MERMVTAGGETRGGARQVDRPALAAREPLHPDGAQGKPARRRGVSGSGVRQDLAGVVKTQASRLFNLESSPALPASHMHGRVLSGF